MNVRNLIIGIGIFAAIIFAGMVFLFFVKLNTTVSDFSGGDAPLCNQIYYNFYHGRPYQMSIYTEYVSQFINPSAYLNSMVFHAYILVPVFVSLFYIFWPDINTMYALFIILNYAGVAFFTLKIFRRISPSNAYLKSILAFSVFLLSGYLRQVLLPGYPIILCAPFILAIYYFLISKNRMAFFLAVASLCLVTEELAVLAITFLAVLSIFEKEYRRIVYPGLAFAVGYFILWNFAMQPVIRYGLIPVDSGKASMFLLRFFKILKAGPAFLLTLSLKDVLIVFSSFYLPILAAIPIYRFFGAARRPDWLKIAAIAFLAPVAFWVYGTFSLSGRHLLPVLAMAYMAFVIFLGSIDLDLKKKVTPRQLAVFFAIAGIFMAVNALVMAPALPHSLRYYVWKVTKLRTGIEPFKMNDLAKEIPSNKEAIKEIRRIPRDRSVVFWGNYSICGFITDRNDIWNFPMYYDVADFLVIQKDAQYSCFTADDIAGLDYKKPGVQDRFYQEMGKPVSGRLADKLKEYLIKEKHTHRLAYDSDHVLVLEKLERSKIYVPKSTVGFGWLENAPKVFSEWYLKNRKGI